MAEDKNVFIDLYLMPLFNLAHELLYISDSSTCSQLSYMSEVITQKPSDDVSSKIVKATNSILQKLRILILNHELTSKVDDAVSLKNIYYILYLLLSRTEVLPFNLSYGNIIVSPEHYVDPDLHKIS